MKVKPCCLKKGHAYHPFDPFDPFDPFIRCSTRCSTR